MKKILTMLAFLFTMGGNINAETTVIPNEVKVEVIATIDIVEDADKPFNIAINSNDSVITNQVEVINVKDTYVVKLKRPMEENEISAFEKADIKIVINTPKQTRIIPGKNITFKKSENH